MTSGTLPGSHLAKVDCIDCGAYVLAVPDFPEPRCAQCGREYHGATTLQVPPPASWFRAGSPAPHPGSS